MNLFDRYLIAVILLQLLGVDTGVGKWWCYGLLMMACIAESFEKREKQNELVDEIMRRVAVEKAKEDRKNGKA